jgi:transposase
MNGRTDFAVKAERTDFNDTLFLAMELSRATWLVATFAPRLGDKISVHTISGGDTKRLLDLIAHLQSKLRGKGVCRLRTVCCYEAGYDGFWLHRVLVNHGVENHVLDPASLPIDRRAKHIKTDNIDAKRLLRAIAGFVQGDPQSCRVVRPPTPEEEDARRLHRERQRLVRERTGHLNRIKALLITHGIRALRISDAKWCERLSQMRTGDGRPIPERLRIEIEREWKRLRLVAEQVREVEAERDRLVKGKQVSGDACTEKMRQLAKLHGIGAEFATVLTREVFYRPFQNRRQVASYVGLTPAPYDSGDTKRDQGIDKAGNKRARVASVQMAWLWLRYQSKSELSLWYFRRVGELKGRVRRIMIIALARKLVIALWRYVETGKVPTGAILTP